VPSDLLNRMVQCPSCQHRFTAGAEEQAAGQIPAPEPYEASRAGRRSPPGPARSDEEEYETAEDEEHYEEERPRRRRGGRRRRAQGKLMGPAIALIIVGSIGLLLAVVNLLFFLGGRGMIFDPRQGPQGRPPDAAYMAGVYIGATASVCWGGIVLS